MSTLETRKLPLQDKRIKKRALRREKRRKASWPNSPLLQSRIEEKGKKAPDRKKKEKGEEKR